MTASTAAMPAKPQGLPDLVPAPLDFGCDETRPLQDKLAAGHIENCGQPDALDLRKRQIRPRLPQTH